MTGCKYKDCPNPRAYPNVNMCKAHIAEESKRRYAEARKRTIAKVKTYKKPEKKLVVFRHEEKNKKQRWIGRVQQMTEVEALRLRRLYHGRIKIFGDGPLHDGAECQDQGGRAESGLA